MKKYTHYLIPIILPLSLLQVHPVKAVPVGIFQMGDPQCTLDNRSKAKAGHIAIMLKIAAENSEREYATTYPGDLIDGQGGLQKWRHFFWLLRWLPGLRKGISQTKDFTSNYLDPVKQAEITTLLCNGNHDHADATQSSIKLIKKEHGHAYYAKKIGNLTFLNCGCYPDTKTVLPWLEKQLKDADGSPVAITFHYNILGNHNNWWTLKERQAFLETIRGKRVQLIMHGHDHDTYTGSIEGIPVVCSGNDKLPLSLFDEDGNYQKTQFFAADLQEDGSYSPRLISKIDIKIKEASNTTATEEETEYLKNSRILVTNDF